MERTGPTTPRLRRVPYLELTAAGYGIWQSLNLLEAWLYSPFDRWGWLAFVLWLAPLLGLRATEQRPLFGGCKTSRPLLLTGLALTFLGDLGSFNASCNAGLALIILSFAPAQCRNLTTGLASASWMTALGWFGSQAALDPATLNALRIGIAAVGAGWTLRACLKFARHENTAARWLGRPLSVGSGQDRPNAPE